MKILAVDDDLLFLDLLDAAMRSLGYDDLTLLCSPIEAMKLIESGQNAFDFFLLDIQMPHIDGIRLCRWLRAQPAGRNASVIMLTALKDRSSLADAMEAGASDYLTKPIDFVELSIRLRLAEHVVTLNNMVIDGKRIQKSLARVNINAWGLL